MLGNFWKINKGAALFFDTIEQTQSCALFCFITKNHTLYIIHCEFRHGYLVLWLPTPTVFYNNPMTNLTHFILPPTPTSCLYPRSKRGMTIIRQYLTISSIVQNVWRKSQPCLINSSITASQDWNTKWESKLEPFYR